MRVKKETVAFETRKWRILEQILIRQPDLCALEEADTYDCFLRHHLPKYGYSNIHRLFVFKSKDEITLIFLGILVFSLQKQDLHVLHFKMILKISKDLMVFFYVIKHNYLMKFSEIIMKVLELRFAGK